jgi:hypothetical protein
LYSEQFDNSAWVKYQGATITSNTVISPDGTQNADTLQVASGQIYSGIYQSISGGYDIYTVSIFLKYNTKRWLYLFDAQSSAQGWFDIQNGVLGTITVGYTGAIENFGNGWYRCSFKKDTAVSPAYFQMGLVDTNGSSAPTSNGSAYIWGAQLEASAYPTSYIPTTSTSVTRLADSCYKTSISSLIGQTSGTMFLDINLTHYYSGGNGYLMQIYQDSSNRILFFRTGSSQLAFYVLKSGSAFYYVSSVTSNTRHKLAFAYESGNSAFYIDGAQIALDTTTFSPFSLSALHLGANYNPTRAEEGDYLYNEALLFKRRLTNTELAQLTTL